jgi:hypothetical protein
MKAGSMRHIVDIHHPLHESDSRGEADPLVGEKYLAAIPCSIEPLNTREQEAARQAYALATHKVSMYADPQHPLSHAMWLVWGKRRLEIGASLLDDRGLTYTLTCGEVVA